MLGIHRAAAQKREYGSSSRSALGRDRQRHRGRPLLHASFPQGPPQRERSARALIIRVSRCFPAP
jgi:hypothetical protein